MDEELVEAEVPSVGERLRAAREEKKMSLEDIAAQTRIPQRHLESLEVGNWAALPAPTYTIGFARSYATAVGLDRTEISDRLRTEMGGSRPATAVPAEVFEPADPARTMPKWLVFGAIAAVVLIVAVMSWLNKRSLDEPDANAAVAEAPAAAPVGRSSNAAHGSAAGHRHRDPARLASDQREGRRDPILGDDDARPKLYSPADRSCARAQDRQAGSPQDHGWQFGGTAGRAAGNDGQQRELACRRPDAGRTSASGTSNGRRSDSSRSAARHQPDTAQALERSRSPGNPCAPAGTDGAADDQHHWLTEDSCERKPRRGTISRLPSVGNSR